MAKVEKSGSVRITVNVHPDTLKVYERLAKVAGTSLARSAGDWLTDTVEAAQFTCGKMEEARKAPQKAFRELMVVTDGYQHQFSILPDALSRQMKPSKPKAAGFTGKPPSSNTGGS